MGVDPGICAERGLRGVRWSHLHWDELKDGGPEFQPSLPLLLDLGTSLPSVARPFE